MRLRAEIGQFFAKMLDVADVDAEFDGVLLAIGTFEMRRVSLLQCQVRTVPERIFHPPLRIDQGFGKIKCFFVKGAQFRKESRGLHFNTDYPGKSLLLQNIVL